MIVLLIGGLVVFLALVFLLVRNSWVCRVRIDMIYKDYEAYNALPSYYYMLYRKVWIWDVKKFLPKN